MKHNQLADVEPNSQLDNSHAKHVRSSRKTYGIRTCGAWNKIPNGTENILATTGAVLSDCSEDSKWRRSYRGHIHMQRKSEGLYQIEDPKAKIGNRTQIGIQIATTFN